MINQNTLIGISGRYQGRTQGYLIILLTKYNYPPITKDKVFKNIFEQAENLRGIDNQKNISVVFQKILGLKIIKNKNLQT